VLSFEVIQQTARHWDLAGAAHGVDVRLPFADEELAAALAAVVPGFWTPFSTRRLLQSAPRPLPPRDLVSKRADVFSPLLRDWLAAQHASLHGVSIKRAWAKIVWQRMKDAP
jgi:hypothetical protein